MMTNYYDLERIYELEQLTREEQMRREQGLLARRGHGRRPAARLAFFAYLLTLFRLA